MTARRNRIPYGPCLLAALCLILAGCAGAPAAAPGAQGAASGAQGAAPGAAALAPETEVTWSEEALAAFQKEVPKMVQKVAKKETERKAREKGKALIDMALYEEIKKESGH